MPNTSRDPFEPVHNLKPYDDVQGTHQIEHFFRAVAGLDVDKQDIRRCYEFVDQKVADLLLMGQRTARANDRVTVEVCDLPITKGLQKSIHAFEAMNRDIAFECILEKSLPEPQLDRPYSDETQARLPAVAGGLSVALARALKVIDPETKRPATEQWERAFRIFDLLL